MAVGIAAEDTAGKPAAEDTAVGEDIARKTAADNLAEDIAGAVGAGTADGVAGKPAAEDIAVGEDIAGKTAADNLAEDIARTAVEGTAVGGAVAVAVAVDGVLD